MEDNKLYNLLNLIFEKNYDSNFIENNIEKFTNDNMKLVYLKKGTHFVKSPDYPNYTYVIIRGEYIESNFSVEGTKILLAVRNAPQLVGIVHMVKKLKEYQNDMVVKSDILAIKVENNYFYSKIKKDGKLGLLLLENLADKVIFSSRKIKLKTFFNAKENFLLYIYEYWNKNAQNGECHLTHQKNTVFAEEIGVSERSIYRILSQLKSQEIIHIRDNKIYLNTENIENMINLYGYIFDNEYI